MITQQKLTEWYLSKASLPSATGRALASVISDMKANAHEAGFVTDEEIKIFLEGATVQTSFLGRMGGKFFAVFIGMPDCSCLSDSEQSSAFADAVVNFKIPD